MYIIVQSPKQFDDLSNISQIRTDDSCNISQKNDFDFPIQSSMYRGFPSQPPNITFM